MLWNKEVFNKMLDFIEDSIRDNLACEISLQEDIKVTDKRIEFVNKDTEELFMSDAKLLIAVKELRSIQWDDYNDEQDITLQKNY